MYSQYKNKSGVYIIKNTINNKVYIGSAKCILSRIKDHLKRLKSNSHRNSYLQRHYNKHKKSFYFEVLITCNLNEVIDKEQYYIDFYQSFMRTKGFNLNPIAKSMLGFKHSEETKQNWSKKRKGTKFTDEAKKNMSLAKSGSKHGKSKLTEKDVLDIRKNYNNKRDYSQETAINYSVSWHTINYILKRKTWKHI